MLRSATIVFRILRFARRAEEQKSIDVLRSRDAHAHAHAHGWMGFERVSWGWVLTNSAGGRGLVSRDVRGGLDERDHQDVVVGRRKSVVAQAAPDGLAEIIVSDQWFITVDALGCSNVLR